MVKISGDYGKICWNLGLKISDKKSKNTQSWPTCSNIISKKYKDFFILISILSSQNEKPF